MLNVTMRPTHAWRPCLMSQIWRWSITCFAAHMQWIMNIRVYTHLQHVGIYVIAAIVKLIQYSPVPRLQIFFISNTLTENLGRDLGTELMLVQMHALSNLQKHTLPTIYLFIVWISCSSTIDWSLEKPWHLTTDDSYTQGLPLSWMVEWDICRYL